MKNKTIYNICTFIIVCLSLSIVSICDIQAQKTTIYFIPGQGSDYRIFENIKVKDDFDIKYITYFTPEKGTSMKDYAKQLISQIDTTQKFILIGVSLGGMLATEMADLINPEKVIIISSAKCRSELPYRYRFQKTIPIYKLCSVNTIKKGAFVLQPLVEPDSKNEKYTFNSMLQDKDSIFLKRAVEMIITWERTDFSECIIHIHGNKDKTIPIRNVQYKYLIDEGSHMMTLTRGPEISDIINEIINK